jgi:hypothetical protein
MFLLRKLSLLVLVGIAFFAPSLAHAGGIVDALDLSPFIPMVLDALMAVGTGTYEYFVGDSEHTGIIYVLIWSFLALTIIIDLVKMYLPAEWVGFLGFSGGGELASGSATPSKIFDNILKAGIRAVIATTLLLQLKPTYITQWLVNPFLEFGSIYTTQIIKSVHGVDMSGPDIACPQDILDKKWLTQTSCEFLTQPASDLTHANNQIVKRGFRFLTNGLRGLMTPIPRGGQDIMDIITGIILIMTFVGSNVFMALLIIQGIFNFGTQIILYPFNVLAYVFKKSDKMFDIWPAFSGLTKALQQLVITMIACAFILCINIAVVKALFQWNSSTFVVAAGGTAISNIPQPATAANGFGHSSILWLSSILTFYLMFKIFELTRQQLEKYVGKGMDGFYNASVGDTKTLYNDVKGTIKAYKDGIDWFKK